MALIDATSAGKSRIGTRVTAALLALAALACTGNRETQDQAGPHTEFRDSAGIRIVENSPPPDGSRLDWVLGPEPIVSIGEVSGEDPYLFTRIFGAKMLSDGRIVIGDDGTNELRVFDRQGNHLETWAGVGQGPGEFPSPGQLWALARLPGDSLIVWGFLWPELSVYGPDGEFLRRFIPERSRLDYWDRSSILSPRAVSRNGLILARQDEVYIDPADIEVWDAGGELRGSLGAHPGRQGIREGDRDYRPVMFGYSAFHQDWGDLFVISTSQRYELRAFALDGSLARIVRLDRPPRSPTAAHIEAEIDESVSRIPSEQTQRRADRRRVMLDMPVAEHLPAFAAYRPDALDHLWVYEYEAPGEEMPGTLFMIFDPEGRALGYFDLPEGMGILEIGADYILARVRDELGVESVQLWPLER